MRIIRRMLVMLIFIIGGFYIIGPDPEPFEILLVYILTVLILIGMTLEDIYGRFSKD